MTGVQRAMWMVDDAPEAVGVLRVNASAVLRSWGLESDGDQVFAVLLALTEMVTNAGAHGHPIAGMIDTQMWMDGDRVTVTVSDAGSEAPVPRTAGPDDESGRGLLLIRAFAESVGCERWPTGKCVWAVIGPHPAPEGSTFLPDGLDGLQAAG
ncbi:ATP-binding protein [Kitasatospora sp. NPDC094028]